MSIKGLGVSLDMEGEVDAEQVQTAQQTETPRTKTTIGGKVSYPKVNTSAPGGEAAGLV